jgi:hypothetical protein
MAILPLDTVRHWKEKLAELRERWRGARQEVERLRREVERLQQEREQWEQERGRQRQENEKLKKQLEEAQRAAKRQAAPFSRGKRNLNPKPLGGSSARSDDPVHTIPADLMPSTLAIRHPGSESNAYGHTCQVSRPIVYSPDCHQMLRAIHQKARLPGNQ